MTINRLPDYLGHMRQVIADVLDVVCKSRFTQRLVVGIKDEILGVKSLNF